MFFKAETNATLQDIAQWLDKDVKSLTVEDIQKIIPKSAWDDAENSPFAFIHTKEIYVRSKWWQRLNMIWVLPVYVLIIGPLSYIVRGKWHISEHSKIGKAIMWLVGE